jgi:ribonuclease Z
MFEIVFLGTSASAPSVHRGLSAQVVMHKQHRFLVDCGEGTQRQILQSGLGFKRLDKILITHGHLDHILGLAGLLSTFARWEAMERLEIWAGAWALERIRDLLFGVVLRGARPPLQIELLEIKPGVLHQDETFQVSAVPVSHRGPDCYGFVFEEKARRQFLPDKAAELGVPAGPERRELVAGRPVTLPDGRTIQPEAVLGPLNAGAKLVHVGDTGRTDNLLEVCRGADGLIIEATYLDSEADLARQFSHLTAKQAASLAAEARVKQLFLTHISRRHRERDVLEEARAIFPDVVVARDFDQFKVAKEKRDEM